MRERAPLAAPPSRSLERPRARRPASETEAPDPDVAEGAARFGRGGRPRLLGEALPALLETLGVAAPLEDARIFAHWEEVVGTEIARVARPHRLDAGTLIVHVKSSPWSAELSLRKSELLARLNAGRERRPIRQIVFRIDVGLRSGPAAGNKALGTDTRTET